jgi:hypothetical protein
MIDAYGVRERGNAVTPSGNEPFYFGSMIAQ